MHAKARPLRTRLAALMVVALAASILTVGVALTAHASIPAQPSWKSSAPLATWNTGKFDIFNNEWNKAEAGPQTIWAYSHKHWGVESVQADTTSVKTFPSVQENYTSPMVASLRRLHSKFQQSMPSVRDF